MIRTSKHTTKFANTGKKQNYELFISEMRRIARIYVDFLWETHYEWVDKKGKTNVMDIKNQQYDIPPYFDYNLIPVKTGLYARALSSLVTQCMGMVKANTEKQKHRLHILNEKKQKNEPIHEKLLENIEKGVPVKPNTENMNVEISSKCADFQIVTDKYFDGFLCLTFGMDMGDIKIPIKFHTQSNKWKKTAVLMGSFLLCNENIQLRWQYDVPLKTEGKIVGGDTGKHKVLKMNDGQVTPKEDIHKHSLDSILANMARKKKGSKNFKQAQKHRLNFINWSINNLNWSEVKELQLEKVVNITFGKHVNRVMQHWVNRVISEKTKRACEEHGVRVTEQSSAYKSQRCRSCCIVLKRNRKGEMYKCSLCGYVADADDNSSWNQTFNLPEVPMWLSNLHLNRTVGFYWKPTGFFDVNGEELRVPHSNKNG